MQQKSFAISLGILALCLAGCSGMPAGRPLEDNYIDALTITNIPLTVNGQPSYKIYVYVTDSMSQHDPHKSQGTALLDGEASVTVPMYKPPEEYKGRDPDDHGEAWSGVGAYFSVIISPQNAPNKEAILVRAGQAFNKSNQNCDFSRLMRVSESSLFTGKTTAIYNEIICHDNKGIGADIVTP
ncbi:MAG: hypothetical protein LBG57_01095 [Treponema sp.]|jgi:hypothetical protein|nr:hypothetical protein [Treponema sp.]